MITQFFEISLTIIGDGASRDFNVDMNKLPQSTLDAMPQFAPTTILKDFSALIGPDGSTKEEATFSLSGRTVAVKAANPLQAPGDNLARYTLNVAFLFPTA